MKQENKILFFILGFIFLAVIGVGYYNYFVRGDYLVTKQVECDPNIDSCFVSDCESNDSECDTTTTYKKISIPSKYAGSDYDSLTCSTGDSFCTIITCHDETVEVGEKCFK